MNDQVMEKLERMLAMEDFREFARTQAIPEGDLASEGDRFSNPATQFVFEAFCAGQGPAGARKVGQQLFAEIKPTSRYAGQARMQRERGYPYPFPVRIEPDRDGYVVKGGIGGQYRLEDVTLLADCGAERVALN